MPAKQMQTWYTHEQNVWSFPNTASHQNHSLLLAAFSNVYPETEVLNDTPNGKKISGHTSVCLRQVFSEQQKSWNYGHTNFK
jgi:hypothetical protein